MYPESTFQSLNGSQRIVWHGALSRLFRSCRMLVESLNADIRAGVLPEKFCARSNFLDSHDFSGIRDDLGVLIERYPLAVQSPFEGVSTISGGIWLASDYVDAHATDALLKLQFLAGTTDLPVHSHDHSDRVILVAGGAGIFELQTNDPKRPEVISTDIRMGDAIVFASGTAHTFKVPSTDLVLLSYHSPFIPLDDPRQYTISAKTGIG